ncbi:DUF4404 family protein [Halioxenophilus sp. WMMB6]|uniref:DUF4404 family protein n=1 Tax=Halioxenophilus sp. WMMB6 TaxID=3073815 RepID=UPI00295ED1A1|nr:DUF4404 family protein [Halioxenophilus sp. WMMB6]
MDNDKDLAALKQELTTIHKEMEVALSADKRSVLDGIVDQLTGKNTASKVDVNLLEELEQQAASLTTEHPRLAAVLREIADQLGKLGI